MKRIILICLLFIVSAVSTAQTAHENQVKGVLKAFYTAYMTEFSRDTSDVLLQLRRKYCTARCERIYKKLINETDADPFINGQDSNASYAKTLDIKRNYKSQTYIQYHILMMNMMKPGD